MSATRPIILSTAAAVLGGGVALVSADSGWRGVLPSWLPGSGASSPSSSSFVGGSSTSAQPGKLLIWGGPFGRIPRSVDSSIGVQVTSVAAGPHFVGAVTADGAVHVVHALPSNETGSKTPSEAKVSGSNQRDPKVVTEQVEGLRQRASAVAATSLPPRLVVLDDRGGVHEMDIDATGRQKGPTRVVNVPVARDVSCGTSHCVAIARDARNFFAWGNSQTTGEDTATAVETAASATGIQTMPLKDKKLGNRMSEVTPSPGHDLLRAAAGGKHTILADKSGRAFGGGNDAAGQLGRTREPWVGRESKQRDIGAVLQLEGLPVMDVAAGESHSVFLLRDGRVLACGANRFGQTGHSNYASLAPIAAQADPGGRVAAVFAGGDVTCVLRESKREGEFPQLLCVGANESGQLGVGTREVTRTWRKVRFEGAPVRPTAVDVGGIVCAAVVPEDRLPLQTNVKDG